MEDGTAQGFAAGFWGACILIVIMLMIQAGIGAMPLFVTSYTAVFGTTIGPVVTWIIAAALFAISGGVWGAIFGFFVRDPSVLKGMAFGILPALWLWLFVAPVILGQPFFFGFQGQHIVLPILFNVFVWGGFVGWYCQERMAARTSI